MSLKHICRDPAESGMKKVEIIEESGQSGDAQVRITLDDGRRIEVATDPHWRAIHVCDADGNTIGWVQFDQLVLIAAQNAA